MSTVRWSHEKERETLVQEIKHLVERALPKIFAPEAENGYEWRPQVDMRETDEAWLVEVDLPGMTTTNISVDIEDSDVVVQGERPVEHEQASEEMKYAERSFGKFYRRVALSKTAKTEEAEARYANGVLTVTVPKGEDTTAKSITVEPA